MVSQINKKNTTRFRAVSFLLVENTGIEPVTSCICDTIRYETSTIALFAYGGDFGTQRNFPKNTTR